MNEEPARNSEKALAYEKNTRVSIPTYDALFAMIGSYFRMQLGDKAASLLLIGAGGGNELSAWGPSNPQWTFTGVDPSKEMLGFAQNKAAQLGMESRIKLIHGTVDELPLSEDSKFDAASCILVLHFVNDDQQKLKLLESVQHHLKPGAPFVLVTAYGDRDDAELQNRLNVWKSFWLDAGHAPSKMDQLVNKDIFKISFLP